VYCKAITHACGGRTAGRLIRGIRETCCVSVRALKAKQLELSTPTSVDLHYAPW